jgi:uncharacterized protein
MKASKYNIFVNHPKTGETILFNSLYGSLTVLDSNEIEVANRNLAAPTHTKDSNIKSVFIEQKYLVDDSVDEMSIIENRKKLGIKDMNRLDLIIMPTLDCNFACVYCYETRRPDKMTDETETAIKKWLTVQIPKYKVVMLHWFGGEPLMCHRRVISITQYIANIAIKSGVSCITHITTNGYLLSEKRIKELIDSGVLDFQITVDGSPEAHDKLRILRNSKGTFNRLFQNINNLVRADERVRVSLRVNFNHINLHSIPRLLAMFPLDVRPHLRVVYEPIFGQCSLSATGNLLPQEISETMADYYKLAEELGYDVVLGQASVYPGKLVYCYAERENQFIINYNCDVYKCSVSEFNPKERIGYIRTDGIFVKDDEQWNKWVSSSNLFEGECRSCVYLPLCMGGCRKMRLQHKGSGSYCSLVPTNTSYILKQVALGRFKDMLQSESEERV